MNAVTMMGAAHLIAALLFVVSLAGLSRHETSRSGVLFGIAGMTIALAAAVMVAIGSTSASAWPCCSSRSWSARSSGCGGPASSR